MLDTRGACPGHDPGWISLGMEAAGQACDAGVQYRGTLDLMMKRIWSWLLGILIAAPIIFLVVLFALVMFGGIYFIWMFD